MFDDIKLNGPRRPVTTCCRWCGRPCSEPPAFWNYDPTVLCFRCVIGTIARVRPDPAGPLPLSPRINLSTLEPPAPPYPGGRTCLLCPTVLSRYNPGEVCGPCERANRELVVPLVFDGHAVERDEPWRKTALEIQLEAEEAA